MAKVKRIEAKIILQKNDEGHWLVVDASSGKHAMVNIENVFKGGVRETLLEWAKQELSPRNSTKKKKTRAKNLTKCPCLKGWVCEDHPSQPWGHRGCGAAGELCKNPQCDKDPDSIFLSVHCRVQPGRRKPPVRKTSLNA